MKATLVSLMLVLSSFAYADVAQNIHGALVKYSLFTGGQTIRFYRLTEDNGTVLLVSAETGDDAYEKCKVGTFNIAPRSIGADDNSYREINFVQDCD